MDFSARLFSFSQAGHGLTFFCLAKRPGAPGGQTKKENRSATPVAKPPRRFASRPSKADKTNGVGWSGPAAVSRRLKQGHCVCERAVPERPEHETKCFKASPERQRAKQTIWSLNSFSLPLSFGVAKESGNNGRFYSRITVIRQSSVSLRTVDACAFRVSFRW